MVSGVSTLQVREGLLEFRAALKAAGGQYIYGTFTYADIVMAILLHPLCKPGAPRKYAQTSHA